MADGKIKQVTIEDGRAALARIRNGQGADDDYNTLAALLDGFAATLRVMSAGSDEPDELNVTGCALVASHYEPDSVSGAE